MTKPEAGDRSLVVLVVEDEFLVALDMTVMLESNGYRVAGPAGTVAESIALIDSDKPDLALLDYRLRGTVVTPVAELLVRLGIPFVMATASEVEKLGPDSPFAAAENVGKPVSEAKLMRALKRAASGD
jgi:CheY-like chemotaxis protein